MRYPTTPDGRYFVVRERLWRCSNPALPDAQRQHWVDELMAARRDVRRAKTHEDPAGLRKARAQVDTCKVHLGERGAVWWTDGAPDFNRYKVHNTPYADWYIALTDD
ncbi:hypothetical protein IFR09_10810 [Pseudomonas syringae]|nr:hypothetical protein [Pseudomonas syringae]MBD8790868.1 hypothetical protein [Pseudomonas syringae]MBD8801996.1 hypothetical protein [Pseudomonas syringae]MBD8811654.1 hypothetical protein [Pseudomonas syringae]